MCIDSLKDKEDFVTFTEESGSGFTDILETYSIVVFPEMENARLNLGDDEKEQLKNFVLNGGRVITAGDRANLEFLNNTFNLSLEYFSMGANENYNYVANDSAIFAGIDLPYIEPLNANQHLLVFDSFPEGSFNIFGQGANTGVAEIPFGSGSIIWLGWSWFNAAPVGSEDGGWLKVLDHAVQ